ncbi:MAG: VanZ family protein [Psychrobacillus psychrodurans]
MLNVYSTYVLYNIVPLTFLFLLIYIFSDIFLDYFRIVKKSNQKRIILYSFIFYLISLIQIKFGGFTLLQNPADSSRTFISTNEWFGIFDTMNFKLSMWSSSAMVYNVIFFIPLGIYLFFLFNLKNNKKAISIIILSCLMIDIAQLFLGWTGITINSFGYLDIIYLLFNISGGVLGIFLVKYTVNFIRSYKLNSQIKIVE